MENEIVNRVALSKLMVVDLEDYYPEGERVLFDIKDWLYEGFVLREKDFRQKVKDYDWSKHENQFIALQCSSDAIVPVWAYMLITIALETYARKVILGSLEDLETSLYQDIINELDASPYQDKPLIIKGCAHKPVPPNAYLLLTKKLKPVAKSIMYGEACSSVPLYKRKK
ncbi:MAG: DUF2480 family protein [Bacteroidota bacterium]